MKVKAAQANPFIEAMVFPVITFLAETAGDMAFQKMVDKDKERAGIILKSLYKKIAEVSKRNKIGLK